MTETGIGGIRSALRNNNRIVHAFGIDGGQTAFLCHQLLEDHPGQMLILVPGIEKARSMRDYLTFFRGSDDNIFVLPDEDSGTIRYDARSRVQGYQRIECILQALSGRDGIFIAPLLAGLRTMCPPDQFRSSCLSVRLGEESRELLHEMLPSLGYERVSLTEVQGQYSIRGDILDVFPPGEENPFRIDFFGDEADAIRTFDPMTQRSLEEHTECVICPAEIPAAEGGSQARLWDYLKPDAVLVADQWDRLHERWSLVEREWVEAAASGSAHPVPAERFADLSVLEGAMQLHPSLYTTPFQGKQKGSLSPDLSVGIRSMAAVSAGGRMGYFADELRRLLAEGCEVNIACSTEERLDNLQGFLARSEIHGNYHFYSGELPSGMYFPEEQIAWISDSDIFASSKKKKRTKKKKKSGGRMAAFADFNEGDYVVHENHGIGRFTGIRPLVVDGSRKDYMAVQYAGSDMLYVPVEQMDLIQPYIGSGGSLPRISRLSSSDWSKTKARAQAAIQNMAEELVELSAQRKSELGYSFGADTVWQNQFEDLFPFEETGDQLRCIEEIKQDMESPWPMDRLLCGDVGFGKTEVAARAVFKCVMDGKQAAMLVPTTLLASQHYNTFVKRFEKFPCNVEMLSRFRSEEQQKEILKKVEAGSIDVLIGTHRMLSKDVRFRDLGLLVIDEEQRFGVQHKEAIKMLKKNVDVLSLSATPIPRTLHMSMSGIRSMSVIEEAPQERYPVQTYVLEEDDAVVREAVLRELDRGGQVFVVFNRVQGIMQIAEGIRHLVPEARIAVAHGRMSENRLEDIMGAFIEHEYDVLVATTIIESGIDIPAANTLIVLDADRYGLSQLYQLRGRVGRSDVEAFAYLMYQKEKTLSETAEQRLKAIREFTEFGSGFRVAMKDLEIRGAGNLIGTEQSGHMMTIGYELYCRMIDDAIRKLKGEKLAPQDREVSVDINIDAFISAEYIPDESTRLDMYKRISGIATEEDLRDVYDEMLDRFGEVPRETVSLMRVALIKSGCQRAGLDRIAYLNGHLQAEFAPDAPASPEVIARLSEKYGPAMSVNLSRKPMVRVPVQKGMRVLEEAQHFIEAFDSESGSGKETK